MSLILFYNSFSAHKCFSSPRAKNSTLSKNVSHKKTISTFFLFLQRDFFFLGEKQVEEKECVKIYTNMLFSFFRVIWLIWHKIVTKKIFFYLTLFYNSGFWEKIVSLMHAWFYFSKKAVKCRWAHFASLSLSYIFLSLIHTDTLEHPLTLFLSLFHSLSLSQSVSFCAFSIFLFFI